MAILRSTDQFLFYFIIPSIIATAVIGSRLYNSRKQHHSKLFKLSQGIIIGNILTTFLGALILIFFYTYTLDMKPLYDIKWEFLTLTSIFLLAIPFGIGIGLHIAGVTLEMILRNELAKPENKKLSKTIHYFHGELGHKIPIVTSLLMFYALTLLDIFKGQTIEMSFIHHTLSLTAGIVIGTFISIYAIMGKCLSTLAKASTVILASLVFVTANEARQINQHPIATIFTSSFAINVIGYILLRQKLLKIRKKIKSTFQYILKWDGITIHKDPQKFRQIKTNQSKQKL